MKKIFSILFLLFIYVEITVSEKVLIMTYVHSRPDFIELHDKTFKVFLKDPYEFVVFNDAPNNFMRKKIEETCKKLSIRCFRVPNHVSNRQSPNHRHVDGIHYSLKTIGFDHDGIVMMIDSDMFLIKPFSVAEYLNGYDLIGGYQCRSRGSEKVVYISPSLVFMDMRKLPNKQTISFELAHIKGLACDVGAYTYYYFRNNPSLKFKLYKYSSKNCLPKNIEKLRNIGFDENSITIILNDKKEYCFEFHGDTNFFHYYAGGCNWPGYKQSYIKEKDRILNSYIHQQIETYIKEIKFF